MPAPRRVRGEFERMLPLIYGVKLTAAWSGFGATAPKVLGVKGIFPLQAPYAPRNEVQWLAYGLLANLFLIWIMRAVGEFYLYHSRLRD